MREWALTVGTDDDVKGADEEVAEVAEETEETEEMDDDEAEKAAEEGEVERLDEEAELETGEGATTFNELVVPALLSLDDATSDSGDTDTVVVVGVGLSRADGSTTPALWHSTAANASAAA